jgi:hypothetical protein
MATTDVIEENGNKYRTRNGAFEVRESGKKNYRKISEGDVPSNVRAHFADPAKDTLFGSGGAPAQPSGQSGGQQQSTTGKRNKKVRAGYSPKIRPSKQYSRKVQKDLSFKGTVREFDIVETTDGRPAPADKIINVYYDSIRVYNEDDAYEVDKEKIRDALYNTIPRVDERGKPVYFPHQARWAAQETIARSPKGEERGYSPRDARVAQEMQHARQVQKAKAHLESKYPGSNPAEHEIEAVIKNKGVVPPNIDTELRRRTTGKTTARKTQKRVPVTRKQAPTRACKSKGKKPAVGKKVPRKSGKVQKKVIMRR